MSWQNLALDTQKYIVNEFLGKNSHAIRICCKQISQFPIDRSLYCLSPHVSEIINYLKFQKELIKNGTYMNRMGNYGLIQVINFTNQKTIMLDPYMKGEIQDLKGDIIPFDSLSIYLKGCKLNMTTDNLTVWYMIRTILNFRLICINEPLMADECFLKLLFQYNLNPESILSKFLKDPTADVNLFNLKSLNGEDDIDESVNNNQSDDDDDNDENNDDNDNDENDNDDNDENDDEEDENNINERFIEAYCYDRIKSMKYLDLINLNYRHGYLAIMVGAQEGDTPMLIALLNRGMKKDLIGTMGVAARDGRIEIVKLLLKYGVDPSSLKGTTAWSNHPQITKLLEAALK